MKLVWLAPFGALAFASGGTASHETKHHWSYSGETDPAHWASLEPDYATCMNGKQQSPIDIQTATVRVEQLPPLVLHYKPSALHIIDNGHTIQVNVPAGSSLTLGSHRYELLQFHFHHPSEEAIDGRGSDMVAHLVHRDAHGKLAVVAVLLKSGQENPLLTTLWHHLPRTKEHEEAPAGVIIDLRELLPAQLGYYSYSGSLTTPPCSEGVRWFVLKEPVNLSAGQIRTFANLYHSNARPVRPLNGRVVLSTK